MSAVRKRYHVMTHLTEKEFLGRHAIKLCEKIGQGSFSTVYRAANERVGVCAIKVMKMKERSIKEVEVLRNLHHPNIVQYIEHFASANIVYLVMDHCNDGDLENYIYKRHKLAESLVKIVMQQLALAMQYLNNINMCHMDIKPKNILICSNPRLTFKLSDFGVAEVINPNEMEKWRQNGTVAYMAPEKIMGKPYDITSDYWSLGVVMFQCLFGRPSYFHASLQAVKAMITKENLMTIPRHSHMSANCENLLRSLLTYNKDDRIKFEDFYKHPFIDINKMPTNENYNYIVILVTDALELESDRKYEESLFKYQEAVSLLHPYIMTEPNPAQKYKMELKFNQYIYRINELCRYISDKIIHSKLCDNSFDLLKTMAKSTPKMLSGINIGVIAEEYFAEGNAIQAFVKINEALALLVPICMTEPTGYRKSLLLAQIDKWLTMGEEIKRITD